MCSHGKTDAEGFQSLCQCTRTKYSEGYVIHKLGVSYIPLPTSVQTASTTVQWVPSPSQSPHTSSTASEFNFQSHPTGCNKAKDIIHSPSGFNPSSRLLTEIFVCVVCCSTGRVYPSRFVIVFWTYVATVRLHDHNYINYLISPTIRVTLLPIGGLDCLTRFCSGVSKLASVQQNASSRSSPDLFQEHKQPAEVPQSSIQISSYLYLFTFFKEGFKPSFTLLCYLARLHGPSTCAKNY